jgi:hypothetical protein
MTEIGDMMFKTGNGVNGKKKKKDKSGNNNIGAKGGQGALGSSNKAYYESTMTN